MDGEVPGGPDQNERIMAALSHVTVLLPFMGALAPIIIWTTQREKSAYVGFQALQAAVYQILLVLIWFAGMACYFLSFFGLFISFSLFSSFSRVGSTEWMVLFPFLIFGIVLLSAFCFGIYGIYAAVMTLQGKDFRYAVLGGRLESYLKKS